MTKKNNPYFDKWMNLIESLKELISQEGQEIVVLNVNVMRDSEKQYNKYMNMVELMKNQLNIVVTTSFVGEQRIFWPYHEVQFYIKEGVEKIKCTGNYEMIQKIVNYFNFL